MGCIEEDIGVSNMVKEKVVETLKRTPFYGWYRKNFYETNIKDYNQEIIENRDANQHIISYLVENKPMMASRLGSTELRILKLYHQKKAYPQWLKDEVKKTSGVFSNSDADLDRFAQLYLDGVRKMDLMGVWFNPFEDVLANEYCPESKLTMLKNLEPYFADTNPWSFHLKGKKVLIVNPPVASIIAQYEKREKLFDNPDILPEFELLTYAPVVSYGGESDFDTWFDALEFMQNDIEKIDFDVAIIGAGAYGLPLASFIKDMGKQAIHIGGAAQLMFGVYGRRWEIIPEFQALINEEWTKPLNTEKPKNASKVENGSYW